MSNLKYAVVGAGAMGALVTRYVAKADKELWFVDPFEAHMKAIADNGLIVYNTFDTTKEIEPEVVKGIHTATAADEVGKADVIIVMVKTIYTRSAIENIQKLAKDDSIILTLQNGIGTTDILAEYFPVENIASGCIMAGSRIEAPGVIRGSEHCKVCFGSESKKNWGVLQQIADDMNAGGGNYELDEDYLAHIWAKVAVNCANNALTGLVHLDLNGLSSNVHGVETSNALAAEVLAVAQAKGIKLTENDIEWLRYREWDGIRSHRPTTYQDFIAKRKTEIEFLNGAVHREGQKLGVPTPYNMVIAQLARIVEETYDVRDI